MGTRLATLVAGAALLCAPVPAFAAPANDTGALLKKADAHRKAGEHKAAAKAYDDYYQSQAQDERASETGAYIVELAAAAYLASGQTADLEACRALLETFLADVEAVHGSADQPFTADAKAQLASLEETLAPEPPPAEVKRGFSDFAGSTLVHSVGGWAALAGAILVGARTGKYEGGKVNPLPGSNIPLATLGTFILWLGWFGFNGASQLAMGTISDVTDVSRIFANTNIAAASGVVVTIILLQVLYRKVDVTMVLNGALAGLVSITAEPLAPAVWQAILIGGVGGAIVVFTVPLLDRFKIDDVVGAIPVHLFAGIWGTLIVPFSNGDASYGVQIVGIIAYGVFTLVAAFIVWFILKAAMGIRATPEEEMAGLDKSEVGVEAYPEFHGGS